MALRAESVVFTGQIKPFLPTTCLVSQNSNIEHLCSSSSAFSWNLLSLTVIRNLAEVTSV